MTVLRPAVAEIDLDAVRHNVRTIASLVAPSAVCAVVKADGYGHGAVPVARAAIDAGAAWLGVALVEEGIELREAGVDAPILVLSEPRPEGMARAAELDMHVTAYTSDGVEAARSPVHLKVDTGMHRVGAAPGDVLALAKRLVEHPSASLEAVWTHCAVADEPDNPYTGVQLARYGAVLDELAAAGIDPGLRHAANSAAAIAHPDSRFDLVRIGIALYGLAPAPALAGMVALQPAMQLKSAVSLVKRVAEGERISYGLRHQFERDTVVATVPIGYADGVPRRLFATGGEVLIGGRRRPIRGVVTMDQLMVDCGDDTSVAAGDEVVLIGDQGSERVTADEWAERLDTINYEIVCGVGPRVPRIYS